MSTTRVLAGLVSNGNVLADGTITPSEIGAAPATSVITVSGLTYPGDDQAANPAGGQTITINGTGFASTPTVYVGGVIAPSVSFISSTQITFTSPAKTAGTYDVYVVNPNGATAIRVYGISYSGTPTWTTPTGELGPVDANFSIQLVAIGDAPMTYALTTGSTLPSGVALSSSGLITGTALTVEQTFNFSVDAIDGQSQETPRSFFVTVSLADPYFKYVSMLLNADPGTNLVTYDASTNNNSVLVNGDVRSDNFTPYQGVGYYSLAFDGSGDYLTTGTTADFDLTGDFTVECWVNPSSSGNNTIMSVGTPRGVYNYVISMDSTNTVTWSLNTSSTWNVSNLYTTTDTLPLNTWTHLAFVKNGANFSIYFNGVSKYSTNSYAQPSTATGTVYVGTYFANTNNDGSFFRGYISNFRVVKGTAVYTAAFTPPTTPLTAITNTKFLIAQSNRLLDNSVNNAILTFVGDTRIHNKQPFTLSSTISTYGCAYFDGSGDSLSSPGSGTTYDLTGDFCVEGWFYFTSLSDVGVWSIQPTSGQAGIRLTTESNLSVVLISGSGTSHAGPFSSSVAPGTNRWNHIAVTRSGSDIRLWLNGVSVGSATSSSWTGTNLQLNIGMSRNYANGTAYYMNGYVTDFRVVKGSSVYTATFTPPTAQLTAITNTQILTAQYNGGSNNSGFKDSSTNGFLITRNGNTTQGTFTPYGSNWSNYFNGSSYLSVADNAAFQMGSGAFTIECWFFGASFASNQALVTKWADGQPDSNAAWCLDLTSGVIRAILASGSTVTVWTGTAPATNTWNHAAFVRNSSNTVSLFLNGTRVATASYSSTINNGAYAVNIASANGNNRVFTGYVSNARVVKGTAVYDPTLTTYTVPTTPLTAISGTSLLTSQSNRFIDTSSNAFTITTSGSPSVQRFSPFSPTTAYSTSVIGGSGYFDGSGDYLSVSNTGLFGSGDWTFECWVNAPVGQTDKPIIDARNSAGGFGSTTGFTITMITSTEIRVWSNGEKIRATANYVNQWLHIALVKSGSTTTMYFNGVSVGTTTGIGTMSDTSFLVGAGYYGSTSINAYGNFYTSNMRVVKGSAVYTSNFTPPTAPVTAITSTALLMDYTNAGILDNAMMNDLETVGNAQISTSVKKYGTGSISFDGTDDRLVSASSPNIAFGTGDFTVEFWLNSNNVSSANQRGVIQTSDTAGGLKPAYTTGIAIYQGGNASGGALSGGLTANVGGTFLGSSSAVITTGTWYHIALVRSSGTSTIYVNGTSVGSATTTGNCSGQNICVGGYYDTTYLYSGYIDDLRITKGVARYTANFTPPTAALKNK